MNLSTIIKDMSTSADGESFCFMRILTIAGALACIAYAAYMLFKGIAVDIKDWATAYTTVTGGGALGVWAKSKAEPEQ